MATAKTAGTKSAPAAKPAAAPKGGRVRQQRTKSGERQCAARPNGPYGINAKAQCTNATRRETAALCNDHEPLWRQESRRRIAAKGGGAAVKASKNQAGRSSKAASAPVESTDDLEAQLEASVAQASTRMSPALARKQAEKRAAAKAAAS
jgi:hypothetical protein